jgi:hypothetical protein
MFWVRFLTWILLFIFTGVSSPILELTKPSIEFILGDVSSGARRPEVKND